MSDDLVRKTATLVANVLNLHPSHLRRHRNTCNVQPFSDNTGGPLPTPIRSFANTAMSNDFLPRLRQQQQMFWLFPQLVIARLGRWRFRVCRSATKQPCILQCLHVGQIAQRVQTERLPACAGRIGDVLFQVLKMGWLPSSPDGIAMCQDGGL